MPPDPLHEINRRLGELTGAIHALQASEERASGRRQDIYERLGGIEQQIAAMPNHGPRLDKHEQRLDGLEAEKNKRIGRAGVAGALSGGAIAVGAGWLKNKLGL